MATVDMRAVERDGRGRLVGQGYRYFTSPNHDRHVTFPRRATIQERVYTAVAREGEALTRREIALALGLKPTPWLIGVIEQMVSDGYLFRLTSTWKNGSRMYLYEVKGDGSL